MILSKSTKKVVNFHFLNFFEAFWMILKKLHCYTDFPTWKIMKYFKFLDDSLVFSKCWFVHESTYGRYVDISWNNSVTILDIRTCFLDDFWKTACWQDSSFSFPFLLADSHLGVLEVYFLAVFCRGYHFLFHMRDLRASERRVLNQTVYCARWCTVFILSRSAEKTLVVWKESG